MNTKMFGGLIRIYRQKYNLTQAQVAQKLGLKISQFISNIEGGRADVSPKMALKLGKILRIPKDNLYICMLIDYREWLIKELGI